MSPRSRTEHAVPVNILLVEDNPGDARLTEEAFRDANINNTLHVATDGEQAMAFLRQERQFAHAPQPALILLDLNLPVKDGRAILKEIKADDRLKTIPVVVLTTSSSDVDIIESYRLHANCYITKPADMAGFTKVLQDVSRFWFSIVQLPRAPG